MNAKKTTTGLVVAALLLMFGSPLCAQGGSQVPSNSIEIVEPSNNTLALAPVGVPYEVSFRAAGPSNAADIEFEVRPAGYFPRNGLSIVDNGDGTAILSGTPRSAEDIEFRLLANHRTNAAQWLSADETFELSIVPTVGPLAITEIDGTKFFAEEGIPYVDDGGGFLADGGTRPYDWSITTGLPPGLEMNANGTISGTPDAGTAGEWFVTVSVRDASSPPQEDSYWQALRFTVSNSGVIPSGGNGPELDTSVGPLPDAMESEAYSYDLEATGGTAPYSWSAVGMPPGLYIELARGQWTITGMPDVGTAGSHALTMELSDSSSTANSLEVQLNLVVLPENTGTPSDTTPGGGTPDSPPPPTVQRLQLLTTSLPAATAGQVYSVTLQATGGSKPYLWNETKGFPASLSLVESGTGDGAIVGTPAAGEAGAYDVSVILRDMDGATTSLTLKLIVYPESASPVQDDTPSAQAELSTLVGASPAAGCFLSGNKKRGYEWAVLSVVVALLLLASIARVGREA